MKTELFKKVYIRSINDLPKKEGWYIVHAKAGETFECGYNVDQKFDWVKYWTEQLDWYLMPIKITDLKTEL